jgi:hypothetical protein
MLRDQEVTPCHPTPVIKGTVSPDFKGFLMTYDIKSVLSAWGLIVFNFFSLSGYFNI